MKSTVAAEAHVESHVIPKQRRRRREVDDRPVGYYANEPDWATSSADEAVDPDALMALFDARREAGAA